MALSKHEIRALRLQTWLGRLAFPWVGTASVAWIRLVRRNRVRDLAPARRAYRRITALGRPTIVCANHLTMFDSIYLHYALGSLPTYFARWRLFAWNVPAVENFKRRWSLRTLTYLAKTVPIDRRGTPEHHRRVLEKLEWLLRRGDVCTIFPEGGRSRTGRVEMSRTTFGVGHVLKNVEDPIVICVYLRGDRQSTYGHVPARGDELFVALEAIEPRTAHKGLRAARDISLQIVGKLKEMEDRHLGPRAEETLSARAAAETPAR